MSAEHFDHTYDRPHPVSECGPACIPKEVEPLTAGRASSAYADQLREIAAEAKLPNGSVAVPQGSRLDPSAKQTSTIQSEPYTFITHLNQKLDRLVNQRRQLDFQRDRLTDDIETLSRLIHLVS